MKRPIATALILAFGLALLAGCGSQDAAAGTVSTAAPAPGTAQVAAVLK